MYILKYNNYPRYIITWRNSLFFRNEPLVTYMISDLHQTQICSSNEIRIHAKCGRHPCLLSWYAVCAIFVWTLHNTAWHIYDLHQNSIVLTILNIHTCTKLSKGLITKAPSLDVRYKLSQAHIDIHTITTTVHWLFLSLKLKSDSTGQTLQMDISEEQMSNF